MSKRNQLTSLQREILAPLIGKIATGFRYETSPRGDYFSDKFTIRLRPLENHDAEVFLGIHYKRYDPPLHTDIVLNLSINLLTTPGIEYNQPLSGFNQAHQDTLQSFLRQPITGFHLLPNHSLILIFAHQSLIFELDQEMEPEASEALHLGWALG